MSYVIAQNDVHVTPLRSARRRMRNLALLAVLLASVVVVLGAFTRLKHAGLGCPDWPGCYGHLMWPSSAEDVMHAEARFPDAPVEHDKTWPEMVHRYFAGMLGLFILALLITTVRLRGKDAGLPIKLPLIISVIVVVQAAFGMWTVTLKLWPQVVTAHLLGGFTTLSLLWLYWLRLQGGLWQGFSSVMLKRLAGLALCVCVLQVTLGGWTSSNYAALACPDLPTCHGQYWPSADFSQGFNVFQEVGPNYLGGRLDNDARTAIHLTHRVGALVVTAVLVGLMVLLWRSALTSGRFAASVLGVVLGIQLVLGVSNIVFSLPLTVAVAHNAVGALLILVLVWVNQRLYSTNVKNWKDL